MKSGNSCSPDHQPLPTLKENEGSNLTERYSPGGRAFSPGGRVRALAPSLALACSSPPPPPPAQALSARAIRATNTPIANRALGLLPHIGSSFRLPARSLCVKA